LNNNYGNKISKVKEEMIETKIGVKTHEKELKELEVISQQKVIIL